MRDWTGTRVHIDALTIVCPDCHAAIGHPCINAVTGQPVSRFPAHARRISKTQEQR
jgi:hypothetical protein